MRLSSKWILLISSLATMAALTGCGTASTTSATSQQSTDQRPMRGDGISQEQLLQLVSTYTPELSDRFKAALDAREKAREEMRNNNGGMRQHKPSDNPPDTTTEGASQGDGTKQPDSSKQRMRGEGPRINEQLKAAVDANDETKIKELLNQILDEMEQSTKKLQETNTQQTS